jgi:hypothetical protein
MPKEAPADRGRGLPRILRAFAVAVIAHAAVSPARADDPFRALDGHWRGGRIDLKIDYARMQANANPQKPFEREPLRIYNRSGSMFVFSIGQRRFIGALDGNEMRLTEAGNSEEELLLKVQK